MVRSDIVKKVSAATGLSRPDSEKVTDIIIESMIKSLVNGDRLELRGFGTLMVKQRGARVARNLKTNETMPLPPRKVVFFKSGRDLKIISKNDTAKKQEGTV